MQELLRFTAFGVVLFCGQGQVCRGQQTLSLAALTTSRFQLESPGLMISSGSQPSADVEAMEPKTSTEQTKIQPLATHRHLMIFRRYDINVRDKAAPGGFDSKYLLVNGLHLATAMVDVALTQHCIASHTCVEGNPLVPSAPAAAYTFEFGLASLGAVTSHYAKVGGSRMWFLTPLAGVGTHAVGIATGLKHF